MSSTTTKVVAGCAVGCLLAAVALVGLGWMGYRWARNAADVVEDAQRAENMLEEEYGVVRAFTPPTGGRVSAARMEVFLAVRGALTSERVALAEAVAGMAPVDGDGGTLAGLRAARAGINLAPRVLEFARARNEALLEAGMGPGEYAWIYWLTYHAWLGHPAGESLLDQIIKLRSESDGSVQMHVEGMDTEQVTWRQRRDVTAMLRNLAEALSADPEATELAELVTAELDAVEDDADRFPWADGLPEEFAAGLDPYRDRLEESYSPAANPFELLELD